MKNVFFPALIIMAGVILIYEPLKANGSCGINPVLQQPAKCTPPAVYPASSPGGSCMRQTDGTCFSFGCDGTTFENATPGVCDSATVTEHNIPRCEDSFAVTAVQVRQYAWGCSSSCSCTSTPTGVTTYVSVCNCRDLTPLY